MRTVLATSGATKTLTTGPLGVCTGKMVAATVSKTQNSSPSTPCVPVGCTASGHCTADQAASPAATAATTAIRRRKGIVKDREAFRSGLGGIVQYGEGIAALPI
jgi:hypothetical protein